MNYTKITFKKTLQVQDFEPEVMEAEAFLDINDNFQECASKLMAEVRTAIAGKVAARIAPTTAPAPVEKTTTEKKVDTDMVLTDTPVKTPAEKKPAQKATKKAAKKAVKKAPVPKADIVYSRDSKPHKDEMAKILTEEFPNWKTELFTQAKALSGKLVGEPIYNHKGVLLDGFRAAIVEGMTADSSDL